MQTLKGHYSPQTAYVVPDYPYGFRLRCKIRYWIEYKRGKGCRMMSQTTNPKRGNEVWNNPKGSTYSRFGSVMMLNDEGHVIHGANLTEYSTAKEAAEFQLKYADALPCDEARAILAAWVVAKLRFESDKLAGLVTVTTTTRTDGQTMQITEKLAPAPDHMEAVQLAEQFNQGKQQ